MRYWAAVAVPQKYVKIRTLVIVIVMDRALYSVWLESGVTAER